jgi:hypothetical protein
LSQLRDSRTVSIVVERVIFLDFDGVTHPFGASASDLFKRVHLLHRILDMNRDLRVVVHSSWRSTLNATGDGWQFSDEEMADFLFHTRPDLAGRFLGTTDRAIPSKWLSIEAWVEKHGPDSSVVIVDDEPRFFPSYIAQNEDPRYRFVAPASHQGLREYTPQWEQLRGWIYSRYERSAVMTGL